MKNELDMDYLRELFDASRQVPSDSIPEDVDRSLFDEAPIHEIENPEELKQYEESVEETKEEEPYETLLRQTAAHAERGAEGLSGFWGDMQQFMADLTGVPLEDREIKTKEELSGFHFPDVAEMEGANFSKKLPKTSDLRELSQKQFGQYLEPKNDFEKATQETAQDIGAMFALPGNISFLQKLALPVVGQTSKQIAKSLGASEKTQDITKAVTMLGATLFNIGNAPRVAAQAMNEAENLMPQIAINARPTETAMQNIRNTNWFRSGITPEKRPAMRLMQQIENQIQNGTIDGRMAMELRRNVNAARNRLKGFNVFNVDNRQALRHIDEVDRALLSSMENYGHNSNPGWWHQYQSANEAFRVTSRSQAMSQFIHDSAGKKLISEAGKFLFLPAVGAGMGTIPVATMGVGAGYGLMKSYQIANRVLNSRILRDHYMDVVLRASRGNVKATQEAIKKFDAAAEKKERQSSKMNPVTTR